MADVAPLHPSDDLVRLAHQLADDLPPPLDSVFAAECDPDAMDAQFQAHKAAARVLVDAAGGDPELLDAVRPLPVEVGHQPRWAHLITLAWIGARSDARPIEERALQAARFAFSEAQREIPTEWDHYSREALEMAESMLELEHVRGRWQATVADARDVLSAALDGTWKRHQAVRWRRPS